MPTRSTSELQRIAARARLDAIQMVSIQGFGYLGQALSSAEIFTALFASGFLREGRDHFAISPGHYVISLYAAAAQVGRIPREALASYGLDGATLEAIGEERTPVVDMVCGSLGQGLSVAIGYALAAGLAGEDRRSFAFLSDGELQEGQIWEAAMFAAHNHDRMGRLVAVIDANNSQVDGPVTSVTTLEPLADKWRAFGWRFAEVNGHNLEALCGAFESGGDGSPLVVIARTEITGGLKAIPPTIDGHFIKLDAGLARAMTEELEASLV
ncbi:MAG: 1-deoxy-D-xylulose-5-phosphate synthase N-terminal domain-containing protein [Roseiarcus sp.]